MDVFNFTLNSKDEIQKGHLLLAEPLMQDPNFGRSVILMCEHDKEVGSFGLIINKPMNKKVCEVAESLSFELDLFVGGPVEQNTLHFIHRIADLEGAQPLKNGYFWGGNIDDLEERYEKGEVDDQNCRFMAGYSGWSERQLATEIKRNSWVIARLELTYLFDIQAQALWREFMQMMGGKYKLLANYPSDPQLN